MNSSGLLKLRLFIECIHLLNDLLLNVLHFVEFYEQVMFRFFNQLSQVIVNCVHCRGLGFERLLEVSQVRVDLYFESIDSLLHRTLTCLHPFYFGIGVVSCGFDNYSTLFVIHRLALVESWPIKKKLLNVLDLPVIS